MLDYFKFFCFSKRKGRLTPRSRSSVSKRWNFWWIQVNGTWCFVITWNTFIKFVKWRKCFVYNSSDGTTSHWLNKGNFTKGFLTQPLSPFLPSFFFPSFYFFFPFCLLLFFCKNWFIMFRGGGVLRTTLWIAEGIKIPWLKLSNWNVLKPLLVLTLWTWLL